MSVAAAITADFRTVPYIHQLREFETSAELPSRALIWQMRTGKSKVVVDTACHLRKEGEIDGVLVFAPNGVHENWAQRELPIHHWDTVPRTTFVWRTDLAQTRVDGELVDDPAYYERFAAVLKDRDRLAWFCFASSTMTRSDVRKLVARVVRGRRLLVVFDEAHDYRRPGSKRTKMARALAKRCPYRRILTGTPCDNSPLHAFSQYELLEPGALGFTKYDEFEKHHAVYRMETTRQGRKYPVLDSYKNLDELRGRIAPYTSSVLRSDCEDLPELVRERRHVELTEEQTRVYKELHKSYEIELNGELVSVGEMSAKLAKLQQVVSGFVIDEYGDVQNIPGENPRLDAVREVVRTAPGRVIVWCNFQEDMDRVVGALTADGHEVLQYHGRTPAAEKARVREAFAPGSEGSSHLVGHPKSGGSGLDLSDASLIVYYSHTFDAIVRAQADERATKVGGGNVRVLDLVAPGVDEYILERTAEKVSIADALTREGLREVINRTRLS